MRTGLTISSVAHATALLWAVLTFTANPLESKTPDSIAVDVISASELSQMTQGSKTAPKQETPKPLVEKQGEKKPPEDHTAKITEKKEVEATKSEPTPPPVEKPQKPEPKAKPEPPKPQPKAEAKPEPKQPEPKVDPIAEALKKDDSKKKDEQKQAEAKPVPTPPKKPEPPKPQPKFDPSKISALLDKREPTRRAATGETVNQTASLGAPTATAASLSQSEMDILIARLRRNWSVPYTADKMIITLVIRLTPDGRLASPPQVVTTGRGANFEAQRDAAVRAVLATEPFNFFRKETYNNWREIMIDFDEKTMYGY